MNVQFFMYYTFLATIILRENEEKSPKYERVKNWRGDKSTKISFFFISFFLFVYFTYVRTISKWHNITKTACSFYHLKDSDGKLF